MTLNQGYLLVSLPFCLRETICSQSDTPAIRECLSWMDNLLYFFFWDPVTSFHFIWGIYEMYEFPSWKRAKLYIPKPSHALLRLNALGSPALRLSDGPSPTAWEWHRTMWRDTPASWHFVLSKAAVTTLEPWTINSEQQLDRFTNWRRHSAASKEAFYNIITHTKIFLTEKLSGFRISGFSSKTKAIHNKQKRLPRSTFSSVRVSILDAYNACECLSLHFKVRVFRCLATFKYCVINSLLEHIDFNYTSTLY